MGFIDKFKHILFDEDIVEVPEENDELPDRTSKKNTKVREEKTGFIDYHNEEDEIDENPIKEIIIPKEEKHEEVKNYDFNEPVYEKHEEKQEVRVFEDKFKDDFNDDFDSKLDEFKIGGSRSSKYDDLELSFMDNTKDEVKDKTLVNSYRVNESQNKKKEIKDYRKMLSDESQTATEKKPFKNTPVISPVWGILDKNYTPDEIVDKTEALNQINCGAVPRTFGPVSYNDQPLPTTKPRVTKEELVELNTTISDMVNEEVVETKKITPEIKFEKEVVVEEKNLVDDDEIIEPTHSVYEENDDDNAVIQTDNYDNYEEVITNDNIVDSDEDEEIEMPTHSIEDVHESIEQSNNEHNDIEDAFDSTSEINSVNDDDNVVDFDTIVPKKKYNDDDEALDNTIETDLFNLIDSMYKNEEDE